MTPPPTSRRPRARKSILAVVLWAFGLATSTLLLGLWGRTVTADQSTLEMGSRAALGTEVVVDRINNWLGEAVAAAAESTEPGVGRATAAIAASPEADRAIDKAVEELVQAALAEPGGRPEIQVRPALEPLAPIVVNELAASGVDVPLDKVNSTIDQAAQIFLTTEETTAISGAAYRARSVLTTVFVVGLTALLLFGSLAVALAEEHLAMVRTLAVRLAVSAVTFTVLLRLGAWAMDPAKGRSPLATGGSVLLGSNHLVLFLVAATALCVALSAGIVIRHRRLRAKAGSQPLVADAPEELPELVTV